MSVAPVRSISYTYLSAGDTVAPTPTPRLLRSITRNLSLPSAAMRRHAATLRRRLQLIRVLGDRLAGRHVELDDAEVRCRCPRLRRASRSARLAYANFPSGLMASPSKPAVGRLPRVIAGVRREVGNPGRRVARDQIGGRGEMAHQVAGKVELVQRRAVLVGDEQVTAGGDDHEALGVEGIAQNVGRIRRDAVHRTAAGSELDRLERPGNC